MRTISYGLFLLIAFAIPASPQTRIDSINTNFRWLGPDDRIIVERYDDPKVANVSCYMSRAATGGMKGGLGFAEDPSRFSIAWRAVGPIAVPAGLPKSEVIAFASASLFFKTFQIHRAIDAKKNVPVYTVVSTKLINGWSFNSISVLPAGIRLRYVGDGSLTTGGCWSNAACTRQSNTSLSSCPVVFTNEPSHDFSNG